VTKRRLTISSLWCPEKYRWGSGYRRSFKHCYAHRNRTLYCERLLTVRFSLKERLNEEAYFKPLICSTRVEKSKTKPTLKTLFGKHPL